MNTRLTSQPLPVGFCALTDAQWQTLVSLISVTGTDTGGFLNKGTSPPEPDMRDYAWQRLNSDGSPDRIYNYWSGLWIARHSLPPGSIIVYTGTVASIPTFDGGEASPAVATPTSGPMWEQYTNLTGRFPIGVGTLPSGAVVGVEEEGGEELHTLTKGEMPEHSHYLLTDHAGVDLFRYTTGDHEIPPGEKNFKVFNTSQTDIAGNSEAHNTMPPYLGVIFIRRTARLFYRV
jgi:hypothetical protein